MTFEEIEEQMHINYDEGYKQGCLETIQKACEWLKDNFANASELLICYIGNSDMDIMIKHFKEYMEEQQ